MCSIILLRQSDSEWPVIIGANRDEMSNRKSLPPSRHWDDRPYTFAGKDLEAGGTWLGINDYGVVCGIMNRINTLGTDPNKRSRGELVLDALDHADANESLSAIVEIEKNSYRGFNMLIADNTNAYWIKSSEDSEVIEYFNIPDGLSMITAYDRNDIKSKRIKNYLSKFSIAETPDPSSDNWMDWEMLLGSTYSDDNDPLSAMCVRTEMGFNTVSSCLIALPGLQPNPVIKKPKFKFSNGSPDNTKFEDIDI
ncbi:MAG: NRDE family protein [Pelagibacterales bacterium]|nr:NRDE family protein [Pelagibacterales bacterium]